MRARLAHVEYGSDMRTAPAFLAGLLVALTLVACVPDDEPVRPEPSPTASPIFASDEEALAAAEAAYGAYVVVSDTISSQGGAGADALMDLVSANYYAQIEKEYAEFALTGGRTSGFTSFDSMTLQQRNSDDGVEVIVTYACLDVSGVRVLDASGIDVTPQGRLTRLPLEITFEASDSTDLIVAGSEVWDGADYCDA